ncbi:MAG: TetR/AcrR family transcriptional regulator [Mycobacterium sp.]|uniref:TetR/AcrR family transcriptional regulator n=1 Tax=Mycobacterium sp. TaxID=1785 RepID=UPI003C59511F
MPPVSQRYRDARRRQIIAAARRCFARAGFHGTSMSAVFAESGLSAGAVYGYFASKDDLVGAIIEEVVSEMEAALDVVTGSDTPPPLHEVLGRVLDVLDGSRDGGELARLAVQVWAEASRNPELAARLSGYYDQMRDRFTTLVQRHQRDNNLAVGFDARHLAQVLTALGPAFLSQRALFDDVTADTFTRGLCGLISAAQTRNLMGRDSDTCSRNALGS